MTDTRPDSLLGSYERLDSDYDEMLGADGLVREHWGPLMASLGMLGHAELARRQADAELALEQDGVSYNLVDGEARRSRPWGLDALPVLVSSEDWARLERGLVQRAELLDLVLADLYGPRRLLASGALPIELILDDPAFLRPCDGIRIPGPKQLFTLAVDLVRASDGTWTVLGDRAQAPSGAEYAMENRQVVSRVFPSIYRTSQVHRVAPYFRTLRAGLQAVAPRGVDDPNIVVLSPGAWSETAFEHAFVASYLGYPLVEGSDLEMRDGRVYLRSVSRLQPVDVILRRVDAWFCDPLELRPDSELGVAGLVEACRAGTVTVVNPLGSGVLENAGLAALLDGLSRHLLGQDLALAPAESWWCGEPLGLSHVLANLETLVLRPTSRQRGIPTQFGPELSRGSRDDLARRIRAEPHRWVGQALVTGSTAPVLADSGLVARPTVLRTFAVAQEQSYAAMTGGLSRVGARPGRLAISNQLGAISKDTWVLTSEPESLSGFWVSPGRAPSVAHDPGAGLSARAAENLFWLGRYAERAEATARFLRAVLARRVEFERSRSGPGVDALGVLLTGLTRVTSLPLGDPPSLDDEALLGLMTDVDRTGTVGHSVQRLLAASEAVRDQLSTDTWLVVGALKRELDDLAPTGVDREEAVQRAIGHVLQSLLALGGLGAESMVRDPAWHFLDAGRRIERALQVAAAVGAVLDVEHDDPTDSLLLESVLVIAESIITYRRRYRSRARLATVLDLVVTAPDNPRSVRYQLDRLVEDLVALRPVPSGELSGAERLALRAANLVHLADTRLLAEPSGGGRRSELVGFLAELRDLVAAAADAIDAESFTHLLPHRSVLTPTDTTRRARHREQRQGR